MSIARLSERSQTNLPHYEERVDLACAFRWTARLNMHEAVANHFSLAVNDDDDFGGPRRQMECQRHVGPGCERRDSFDARRPHGRHHAFHRLRLHEPRALMRDQRWARADSICHSSFGRLRSVNVQASGSTRGSRLPILGI